VHCEVHCVSYSQESGEQPETMSHTDAAMFPIIASAALFALYVFFQVRVHK
jgi:minor histocompatibility antigen H13